MRRREIRHSSASHEDYALLLNHVTETRGPSAALDLDALLERAIGSLAHLADRGRVLWAVKGQPGPPFREIIAKPYRIVYRVVENEVWIVAIVDTRRQATEMLVERFKRFAIEGEP